MPDPDYAQWRVDIKVKFRDNEKLQLLTGQRQSGGVRLLSFARFFVILAHCLFGVGTFANDYTLLDVSDISRAYTFFPC